MIEIQIGDGQVYSEIARPKSINLHDGIQYDLVPKARRSIVPRVSEAVHLGSTVAECEIDDSYVVAIVIPTTTSEREGSGFAYVTGMVYVKVLLKLFVFEVFPIGAELTTTKTVSESERKVRELILGCSCQATGTCEQTSRQQTARILQYIFIN